MRRTSGEIAEIIGRIRDEYVATGKAASYWAINNGSCKEFALDVLDAMGGETAETYIVWNGALMIGSRAERPWEGIWDASFITAKWGIVPPHGLDWLNLNQIPFGNHVWVVHLDRHYDAECPEGVDDFFLLPLFDKHVAFFLAEARCANDLAGVPAGSRAAPC